MSEQELAKLPRCYFCKQPMGEGSRTIAPPGKHLYLCDTCRELLRAVVHDLAYSVFSDIVSIMASPDETWVEQLENYDWEHSQP